MSTIFEVDGYQARVDAPTLSPYCKLCPAAHMMMAKPESGECLEALLVLRLGRMPLPAEARVHGGYDPRYILTLYCPNRTANHTRVRSIMP